MSNVRMNEIEHHIVVHLQDSQQRIDILEEFDAWIDDENRSKKNEFEEIFEFQNTNVYVFEKT